MKRELWLNDKYDKPCPTCNSGHLVYDSKQAFSSETKASLENNEYNKNGIVYPESNYLVTAHLKCSECADVVTVTYEKTDDVRWTDDEGNEISYWNPVLFHPAPHIIHIPGSCDTNVKKHLLRSFGLFWYDAASCGNRIRVALEALLDTFGISGKNAGGGFVKLGNRLTAFAKTRPDVEPYLDAVRWIGNSASHDDLLKKEDLLDAYELTEYALELLYREQESALLALSKSISAKKGPVN